MVGIDDYVGDFYSEELDVTYHLAIGGNALGVRIGRWPNGAQLVGGCCGTGPEHIRALRSTVDTRHAD